MHPFDHGNRLAGRHCIAFCDERVHRLVARDGRAVCMCDRDDAATDDLAGMMYDPVGDSGDHGSLSRADVCTPVACRPRLRRLLEGTSHRARVDRPRPLLVCDDVLRGTQLRGTCDAGKQSCCDQRGDDSMHATTTAQRTRRHRDFWFNVDNGCGGERRSRTPGADCSSRSSASCRIVSSTSNEVTSRARTGGGLTVPNAVSDSDRRG